MTLTKANRCRFASLFSMSLVLVSLLASLFGSVEAQARDLQGRLGLGFNGQFANREVQNGVPGLSLKYALTRDIAAEAVLGVSTSVPKNSVTGVKFYKNVFLETNLNFFFAMGGAILSVYDAEGTATAQAAAAAGETVSPMSKAAFQFLGGLGVEFFIPGLESLGFSMEAGISLDNANGSFGARTYGASFVDAGMHFYF